MNLVEQAEAFRNLSDEQYADILNGRVTVAGMLARIENARDDRAELIARKAAYAVWDEESKKGTTGPEKSRLYNAALNAARAAALAALTEMEQ